MVESVTVFDHVEIVHPDPDAAAEFMREVFDAKQIERRLCRYVEKIIPGIRVVHMLLGGVKFQFVKPGEGMHTWHKLLDANGPYVHNVTLHVDGLERIRDAMIGKGCQQVYQADLNHGDTGLDAKGQQRAYVIDAIAQTGMRFEMLESMPGKVRSVGGDGKVFGHMEMVHPDPEAAGEFMQEVFGAVRIEQHLSSYVEKMISGIRVVNMRLGGVKFQFVKPGTGMPTWQKLLDSNGPCVHNVNLLVDGLERIRNAMIERGCQQVYQIDLNLQDIGFDAKGMQRAYVIDALAQTGMRFEMMDPIPGWVPGKSQA